MGPHPLGSAPLGLSPQTLATPYVHGGPPSAIRLDPATRDAPLDENGRYEDMGTIEQAVAISFAAPRRSLKHAPNVGHDLMAVGRGSRAKRDAELRRAAARATPFDRLLRDGLVELVGVETFPGSKSTEARIAIRWRKTGATRSELTPVGS